MNIEDIRSGLNNDLFVIYYCSIGFDVKDNRKKVLLAEAIICGVVLGIVTLQFVHHLCTKKEVYPN
jgi:hypothetical protein